jgi:hypothetical protein
MEAKSTPVTGQAATRSLRDGGQAATVPLGV